MAIVETSTSNTFKNILYLTDFSKASKAALAPAMTVARNYGAVIHVLHVLVLSRHNCINPELRAALYRADEEITRAEMDKLDSELAGINHQTMVERGAEIWPAVEEAIKKHDFDLLVLGTHGRTGSLKLRLGSVAEEIFRRCPVPVLTIGPEVYGGAHNDGRFCRVLFATDFEAESDAAAHLAVSLAQENKAQLILLHVLDGAQPGVEGIAGPSVAEIMHELHEIVPKGAELCYRSEVIVKYGDPAKQIVETAKGRCADLIVLGVRDHADTLDMATHVEKATAHKVLVHARCPILTVRGLRCAPKAWPSAMEATLTVGVAPRSCSMAKDSTAEKLFGDGIWKMLVSKHGIH